MNYPASWRVGRLAGWALLILADLFLVPGAARADCGDYVVTRLSRAGTLPAASLEQMNVQMAQHVTAFRENRPRPEPETEGRSW